MLITRLDLFVGFDLIKFATAEHATDPVFVIIAIKNIMLPFSMVTVLALLVIA